ncbi:MAG: HAMP domain-containing histidine kinase [Oscillospiraceae bacterium]|jgi:signal transduction histidine kinase|nr:HAMP domain-containing histidine kinase [Oscillospiraceae bacterium]
MKAEIKQDLRRNGLLRRWILIVVGPLMLSMLLFSAAIVLLIRHNYRQSVQQLLGNQNNGAAVAVFFADMRGKGIGFERAAQEYAESFVARDQMELWVIDGDGRVVASSGALPSLRGSQMQDYMQAIAPGSRGSAYWRGSYNGQSVMCYTVTYNSTASNNQNNNLPSSFALRYLVSLKYVNQQITRITALIGVCWLAILLLTAASGFYFIWSILRPLDRLRRTAAKLADGDFAQRVAVTNRRDEIAQLGKDINRMANEIASADKMKLDFISTISHELRTPLTAIKGWGETILKNGETDVAVRARGIRTIIDEAGRLTHLVEELLDFSRLQSNRLVMHKEHMDILAELDDAVFMFRERAQREGITFTCLSSDIPAAMQGDPARIRQIFINVLDNAFKYTPQGGRVAVVAAFDPPPPQIPVGMTQQIPLKLPERLVVTVQDTGSGVAPADLPHIAEKFYKASVSTKGAGIGLAVVAEIIRFHDCVLDFENPPGGGFLVKMIFPLLNAGKRI